MEMTKAQLGLQKQGNIFIISGVLAIMSSCVLKFVMPNMLPYLDGYRSTGTI